MVFFIRLFCIYLCAILLLSGCAGGVRVKKGDTLYSIARKNEVPMRAIIEENNLKPPYTLYPGQYLYFPSVRKHKVRRGDTLYSIAKRYDMSVNSLARLNGIRAPYQIQVGQMLKISSWTGDEEAVSSVKSKSSAKKALTSKKVTTVKPPKNPNTFKGSAQVPRSQKGKRFVWPVYGKVISDFGNGNDGINIAGKIGDSVKAADNGTVAYAGNELKGYGNLILIQHKNGWITAYAHNDKLLIKKGQSVKKGQKIAEIGKTGSVKTPQLHFEIRYKAKVVNPRLYLP